MDKPCRCKSKHCLRINLLHPPNLALYSQKRHKLNYGYLAQLIYPGFLLYLVKLPKQQFPQIFLIVLQFLGISIGPTIKKTFLYTILPNIKSRLKIKSTFYIIYFQEQRASMESSYQSIQYSKKREINYLKDLKCLHSIKNASNQKFNSDRQGLDSVTQKLYKKIVRQGYIQKAKDFAVAQIKKKIQTKYDLTDKFIDDEEAFTQCQTKKRQIQYSKCKALSNITIEEFYKQQNTPTYRQISHTYTQAPKTQVLQISQLLKNPQVQSSSKSSKRKYSQKQFQEIRPRLKLSITKRMRPIQSDLLSRF